MKELNLKGKSFFLLGISSFLLLASEFFVLFLDSLILGKSLGKLNLWKENWYFLVFHWIITILIWGTGTSLILLWLKRREVFYKIFPLSSIVKTLTLIALAIIIAFVLSILEAKLFSQGLFQIVREFEGFYNVHGKNAIILSIFQNIYYFFESLLVVLIVAFFQTAGEIWFKLKIVPWGSIGLFLTWGLGHFLSHPQGALYIAVFSLIPGFFYMFSDKNIFSVFFFVFFSFIF